jgi:hypothetical protein
MTPYQTPQAIVSRALFGGQQQAEGQRTALERGMAERGITGPAAESLRTGLGEQNLIGKYGLMSDIGVHEAGQTQAQEQMATNLIQNLFGQGVGLAQSGRALLPGIMGGQNNLMGLYRDAAANAGAPFLAMSQGIPAAIRAYFAGQTPGGTSPYSTGLPQPGGSVNAMGDTSVQNYSFDPNAAPYIPYGTSPAMMIGGAGYTGAMPDLAGLAAGGAGGY